MQRKKKEELKHSYSFQCSVLWAIVQSVWYSLGLAFEISFLLFPVFFFVVVLHHVSSTQMSMVVSSDEKCSREMSVSITVVQWKGLWLELERSLMNSGTKCQFKSGTKSISVQFVGRWKIWHSQISNLNKTRERKNTAHRSIATWRQYGFSGDFMTRLPCSHAESNRCGLTQRGWGRGPWEVCRIHTTMVWWL